MSTHLSQNVTLDSLETCGGEAARPVWRRVASTFVAQANMMPHPRRRRRRADVRVPRVPEDVWYRVCAFLSVHDRAQVRQLGRAWRRMRQHGDERVVVPVGTTVDVLEQRAPFWHATSLRHIMIGTMGVPTTPRCCEVLSSLTTLCEVHLVMERLDLACLEALPSSVETLRVEVHDDHDLPLPDVMRGSALASRLAAHVRAVSVAPLHFSACTIMRGTCMMPNMLSRTMAHLGPILTEPAWHDRLQKVELPVLTMARATTVLRVLVCHGVRDLVFGILTPAQGLPDLSIVVPPAEDAARAPIRLRSLTMMYGGVRTLEPLPHRCPALERLDLSSTYENCLEDRADWSTLFPPTTQLRLPVLRV